MRYENRRGRPRLADKDEDRCQAATIMTRWKILNKRGERCPFMAKWAVQGKQFCRHHAVLEAFAIGHERGYVKRLTAPAPIGGQRVRLVKR